MITSMHPLRVYLYEGDALFRFCPSDYRPFDPQDRDKYVIGDDYTPMWEVRPSIALTSFYTRATYPRLACEKKDHSKQVERKDKLLN